jgi:hypothetical protein
MSDDELKALVLEAMKVPPTDDFHYPLAPNQLRYFAALVKQHLVKQGYRKCAEGQKTTQFCGMLEQAVTAEREACAKVCDAERALWNSSREALIAGFCAAAIRARGEGK